MAAASSGQGLPDPGGGQPPAPPVQGAGQQGPRGQQQQGPQGPPQAGQAQAAPGNYAQRAATAAVPKYIHLHLHRENKDISFNLSKKEKAALMFRRLKLEPKQVIGIESCNFEQIRIEVRQEVDIERFKTSVALDIRPGLKVKPMKELKRTTRVKVCWVPLDVPNEAIIETLSLFGKVTGEPKDLFFEISEEEAKDGDLFGLRHIKSGERAVEIELLKNIPSYVRIAGKRARIWYPGQNFTCGRCYKSFRSCPGKADRRECLRLKGKEKDFEEFWQETLAQQPRKERMSQSDSYGVDTVDLSRVPDDVEKPEIILWLQQHADISVDDAHLEFSGYRGTWRLKGIPDEETMRTIVSRVHGAKIRPNKQPILCIPIKAATPNKVKTTNVEPGSLEGEEMEIDPTKNSTGVESAAEKRSRQMRESEETRQAVERERQRLEAEKVAREQLLQQEQQQRDAQAAALGRAAGEGVGEGGGVQGGQAAAGKDGDVAGPIALVGGGAGDPDQGDSASRDTRVSTNLVDSTINTITNFGQTVFGFMKPQGPVKVGKSSAHGPLLAPQPGVPPVDPVVLVQETPADAQAGAGQHQHKHQSQRSSSQPPQVPESPTLRTRDNGNTSTMTIESENEIFNVTNPFKDPFSPSLLEPQTYTSDFARRLSMSAIDQTPAPKQPEPVQVNKRKAIVLKTPGLSSVSSLSDAASTPGTTNTEKENQKPAAADQAGEGEEQGGEKSKMGGVADGEVTPESKEPEDKDAFTKSRTKNQKKKDRRKTAAKRHKKF